MTIVITAFERSPDGGMGLARDTRVRWALEEVGRPYEVRLVAAAPRPSADVRDGHVPARRRPMRNVVRRLADPRR